MTSKQPKVLKGEEAKNLIKDYMISQNRPYNSGTVLSNLKNQVGKADCTRILDNLVSEGVLMSKDYKKLRYYWANQENIPVSDEKIEQVKNDLAKGTQDARQLGPELGELEKTTKSLRSTPTNSEISQKISELEQEIEELKGTLSDVKNPSESSNTKVYSKSDVEKIDKALETQVSLWRKRKRCAMDIVNSISEGSGKTTKALFNDIGLEKDEDYKCSISEAVAILEPATKRKK